MKKMKLFNIDPQGFAKIYGFIMAIVGVFYGAIYACMFMFIAISGPNAVSRNGDSFGFGMMNNMSQPTHLGPGLAFVISLCLILVVPVVCGAIGFVVGYIEVMIVNKILEKIGGLELTFKE